MYIYIYVCGSCLNKCISVALGPPKQKFLAPPLDMPWAMIDISALKPVTTICVGKREKLTYNYSLLQQEIELTKLTLSIFKLGFLLFK